MTANSGYGVKDVKVDGTSVGPVTSYTFDNVKETHTIEVVFDTATIVTDDTSFRNAVKQDGIIVLANDITLDDNGDLLISEDIIIHGAGHEIVIPYIRGSNWSYALNIGLLDGSKVIIENGGIVGEGYLYVHPGASLNAYTGKAQRTQKRNLRKYECH